jgi:probable phosphoglycerate mutase
MTRTLLLIRHGQIRANTIRRWHGATDSPLTALGRRQAGRLANYLGRRIKSPPEPPGAPEALEALGTLDAIYSSPLSRCHDTALELARSFGQEVKIDDGLREYGIGQLENLPVKRLHEEHDFFRRIFDDADYAPVGGDSINAVAARIVPALRRIHDHEGSGVVAVVSHGAALGIALATLLDENPMAWRNYHVDNCSITELRLAPRAELGEFNQTSHL